MFVLLQILVPILSLVLNFGYGLLCERSEFCDQIYHSKLSFAAVLENAILHIEIFNIQWQWFGDAATGWGCIAHVTLWIVIGISVCLVSGWFIFSNMVKLHLLV